MAEVTKGSAMDRLVEYTVQGNKVQLTPNTVRNYLVSGDKDRVTIQEVVVFMNLCKFQGLNPWAKEAYLIKYGNDPATMVVGKEAFQKRAEANPNFDGMEAGVIILTEAGDVIYRNGTLKLPNENIVGGWAEVWRKDRQHSYRIEVAFEEYAARRKDGSLNTQWSKRPGTMIRKVALVQALREAFPSDFGGMYSAEEQGVDDPEFVPAQVAEPAQIQKHEEKDPFAGRVVEETKETKEVKPVAPVQEAQEEQMELADFDITQ